MKTKTLWRTSEGTFITDPATQGYAETDCGPDMLCRGETDYCERVNKIRVHVAAVDGDRTKILTPQNAADYIRREFNEDGYVSFDGIARCAGIEYRKINSRLWCGAWISELLSAL